MKNFAFNGFGIGLRPAYYQEVLETLPAVDWFEIVSEDFMVDGGSHLHYVKKIREHYPVAMHGVSLSIGSCDPLNQEYLNHLKKLVEMIDPLWISDHFCWTGVNGINMHDLMPLPYTEECIELLVNRIDQVQNYLGRQILLENVSSYINYHQSTMSEWEFISTVAHKSDCYILLDINNIFVNSYNHSFDADEYIAGVPVDRVKQFHLAGHDNCLTHIVDTHDNAIIDKVWNLYEKAIKRFGAVATLIERDSNIPPLEELLQELNVAREISEQARCEQAA